MSVNDIWNLQVRGTVFGTQHIHSLHFRETALAANVGDLRTAYEGAPLTAYRALFPSHQPPVQMIRYAKVCGGVPLPAPTEIPVTGAASMGTRSVGTAEGMPSFIASLVTVRSTTAGRRYNGRFFIGGLVETDCNTNDLQSGYITLLQAYCSALTAAFVTPSSLPFEAFVFSNLLADGRPANSPGQPPAAVAAVQCGDAGAKVVSYTASTRPTTMRSRKLGHGI